VFIITFIFGSLNVYSQTSRQILNGFEKFTSGEIVEEDCSCTPNAKYAIVARCIDDKSFIEWQTDVVPDSYSEDKISFIWSGGYSTGTQDDLRTFSLFINDKYLLTFATASRIAGGDWEVKNEFANLSFKNQKFYNRAGNKKDFWGFFILTVSAKELNTNKTLNIKIKGDNSGSKHWYRTMAYKLLPEVKISSEKIVTKRSDGKLFQRVKILVDHYSEQVPVKIFNGENTIVDSVLNLGRNQFYAEFEKVDLPKDKMLEVMIDGVSNKYSTTLEPVKEMTFYLLPHSHVDIGYTELQTEVEKKQWKNIEEAINLSKQSDENELGSRFIWNTEVLWQVKSYLEMFPEKRIEFINAVKKGWIGLDATYANTLTGLCRPEELYKLVEYSNQLEKEIGIKIESAMISDVPGYSWGIVQAFADNGIKYFSVAPNESDRIGNTIKYWGDKPFYWESPSGNNRVLVWLAGKGYSWFHHWDLIKDDKEPILNYINELEKNNYPYNIVQLHYAVGGDNGPPDSLLAEFVRNWNATHVTPRFRITATKEMFLDLESRYGNIIPTYRGDFTPYWEDGAASSAKETALNRSTSERLNQLETLNAISGRKNYPHKDFDEAWRNVLLFSEHTWGAYNSISEPESDFVKEQWNFKRAHSINADSIANKLLNDLSFAKINQNKKIEFITVWNCNSWKRSDVVTIPSSVKIENNYLVDELNNIIPTQRMTNGDLVFIAKNIPALSSHQFHFVKEVQLQQKVNKDNNDYTKISAVVYLSNFLKEYLDSNSGYGINQFICTGRNATNPITAPQLGYNQKEIGDIVNSIEYIYSAPGCNNLTQEIRKFRDLERIEIINTVDKQKVYEKENLRFAFTFNIENPVTRIDIAWGVIRPEIDQLQGANKNYFSAQRWVDVSNDTKGITLATIDAPFIEVGGMNGEAWTSNTENKWEETAFSSSKIFSWVMNNSWHTNYKAEQEGIAKFRYSLQPHNEFDYLKAYRFGVEQSQPLIVTYSDKANDSNQFLILDENSSVVLTSLRQSRNGNGVIIRLYNPTDKVSSTSFMVMGMKSISYLSNGDEKEIKEVSGTLEFGPFEVMTLKINCIN